MNINHTHMLTDACTHTHSAHRKLTKMSEVRDSEIILCIKTVKRPAKLFRVNIFIIIQRFTMTQGVLSKKNS